MNKPLIFGITGFCALLAVGLIIKHSGGPDADERAREAAGAPPLSERSDSGRSGFSSRAEHGAQPPGGGSHSQRQGKPGAIDPQTGSRGEGGDTASGSPSGIRGGAAAVRRGQRFALPDQGAAGADESGSLDGDVVAPEVSLGVANSGGLANRPVGSGAGTGAKGTDAQGVEVAADPASGEKDPEAPVLALFDADAKSEQAQAIVDQGVTVDADGARFSLDSEFAVPVADKMTGEAGSISFWVRPDGTVDETTNASLMQLRSQHEYENRLQLWQDGAKIRMVFSDSTGTESGVSYEPESWTADEWRLVTTTWGDGQNALYVNGNLVGQSQYQGKFEMKPNTLLHIGSNYPGDSPSLMGQVSQLRVYNRSLSPQEIAQLPSHAPK